MPRRFVIMLSAALATILIIAPSADQPARAEDGANSVAGPILSGPFQSGSEARRAASCGGDYVCDEDGSWAIADVSPTDQTMQSSLDAIERVMQDGKVTSGSILSPTAPLARD